MQRDSLRFLGKSSNWQSHNDFHDFLPSEYILFHQSRGPSFRKRAQSYKWQWADLGKCIELDTIKSVTFRTMTAELGEQQDTEWKGKLGILRGTMRNKDRKLVWGWRNADISFTERRKSVHMLAHGPKGSCVFPSSGENVFALEDTWHHLKEMCFRGLNYSVCQPSLNTSQILFCSMYVYVCF